MSNAPHLPGDIRIDYVEPPVPEPLAGDIYRAVFAELKEEFLADILAGRHNTDARFTIGIARAADRLAACCWTGLGRRRPDIGVMAGVVTLPEFRGKGIASAMVSGICEHFDRLGGRRLFLGVTNPVARRIYEKLGFRDYAGHILMRGEPLRQGGDADPRPVSRPATPGDIGLIVPLYLDPHPAVLLDAALALPSSRLVPPWRCVRLFWDTWSSIAGHGQWRLLEDPAGRLIGSALARPAGLGYTVDFLWSPRHPDQGRDFVAGFLTSLAAPCEMRIAAADHWKLAEARHLGFRPLPGPSDELEIQGHRFPLTRHRRP